MSVISNGFMRFAALTAVALSFGIGVAWAETVEKLPDTSRVVSVGGAVTEIVYALGAEKMLVARDQTSLYPKEVQALPDVGYMRRLAPEGVLSVNPSGILLVEGSGPPDTLEVLKKATVPMVIIPEKFDRNGVIAKIDAVGKALGLEDRAKALASDVARDLDEAEKLAAGRKHRKRVLFVLSVTGGRLTASGTGTAADGAIRLAGAENVITEYAGYKQLTDEAIEKAAPDVILMMQGGGDHSANDDILNNPMIAATPAGRERNLVRMDALYLLGFGPRTGAAVRELAEKIYDTAPDKQGGQ
ncbi:ABC transporter substrate-binding protein [Brucella sp. BE17]|uniref:heme/hemin ABC transporter substrate-binding protein n=1 Tax=Brucella sp. BE17 TaxID=3142977 RepID=UPI0031BB8120